MRCLEQGEPCRLGQMEDALERTVDDEPCNYSSHIHARSPSPKMTDSTSPRVCGQVRLGLSSLHGSWAKFSLGRGSKTELSSNRRNSRYIFTCTSQPNLALFCWYLGAPSCGTQGGVAPVLRQITCVCSRAWT